MPNLPPVAVSEQNRPTDSDGNRPLSSAPVRRRTRQASPTPVKIYASLFGGANENKAANANADVMKDKVVNEKVQAVAKASKKKDISLVVPWVQHNKRLLVSFGFAVFILILIGLFVALKSSAKTPLREDDTSTASSLSHIKKYTSQPLSQKDLEQKVHHILGCNGLRQTLFDILAGVSSEFESVENAASEDFVELPPLASITDATQDIHGESESKLAEIVAKIAFTGGGWPEAVAARILSVLDASCEADTACSKSSKTMDVPKPLLLEVDEEATSEGATTKGSTWVHQAALKAAAVFSRSSNLKARVDRHHSRPASTVTSDSPAAQGDCFAMRGSNTSIGFHVKSEHGTSSKVRHIVIEQPRRLIVAGSSAPRRFQVWGKPAFDEESDMAGVYSMHMGSFEYALAAPAAQTFELQLSHVSVVGLQVVFDGPGWGAPVVCINRIRAYDAVPPICSSGRLVVPMPQ